jgi:hypothetical protein
MNLTASLSNAVTDFFHILQAKQQQKSATAFDRASPLIHSALVNHTYFLVQKLVKARKKSFELKKAIHQKQIDSSVSARKLKWLDSAHFGKFQLELITIIYLCTIYNHHQTLRKFRSVLRCNSLPENPKK